MREYMAQLGFRTVAEMVGHVECLDANEAIEHWKARNIDLSAILHRPDVSARRAAALRRAAGSRPRQGARSATASSCAKDALEHRKPVEIHLPIRNVNRTVGTMLSAEVSRRFGARGTAALHDSDSSQGFGRPEFRRVARAGRRALSRRRRERLLRQGTVGRIHRGASAARSDLQGRGEHHHRQRRALRRDRRRGVLSRRRGRAIRGAQQRRDTRSSKASAITAAST